MPEAADDRKREPSKPRRTQDSPKPRRWLWRGLCFLVFSLVALEVLYLIAANVFLNTELGPQTVNRRPEKWRLDWQSGWTVIPGRIRLSGLVFDQWGRRQDVHVEARQVAFDAALLPLRKRRFVTDRVAIDGVSVAVDRGPKDEATSQGSSRDPSATTSGRSGKPPWRIELINLTINDIESFAVDDFNASGGQASFGGDFEAEARGEIQLPRGVLEWHSVVLRQGEEVLAEPLILHFDGSLSAFDPKQTKGRAVLDHLNGHLEVHATASRLAILRQFLHKTEWIEALDGRGSLRAALVLSEGHLQSGSELEADAEALRLDFLGYATEGTGGVHGSVNEAGEALMEVVFNEFAVRRKPATDPYLLGEGFRLAATAPVPELKGASDLEVTIDMPRAEVPNMAVYGQYLPSDLGLVVDSGRGLARLHLEASAAKETVSGQLEIDAERLAGHFQDLDFEATLEVRTRVSGGDLDDLRLEIEGTQLKLTDGVFRDERNTQEKDWWMTIDVPKGTAQLGGNSPQLEADVEIAMRDTRVIIAMFAEIKTWMQRLEKILTVKDVTATGRVTMANQSLLLRDLQLEGRRLRGRAELELNDEQRRSLLYVRFRGLSIGLEQLGEERDWRLIGGVKKWFDRRQEENWSG